MNNYAIEPVSDAIFDELGPLMFDAFGHQGGREYFDWKYRKNPAGTAIGNIARAESGEIAAFYGMIPEFYTFRGESRRVYQSCDTMTHSAHRRRGLFQKLAERTYLEALSTEPGFFAFGFSGPTSTPGFLKMGWRISEELPFLFRPYPLTLLRSAQGKVRLSDLASDELLAMMKVAQPASGPGVCRSEEFIRWRLANPNRKYEFVVAEGAYAVYSRMERFLFINDFWEHDRAAGSMVISALCKLSSDAKMKGLLTFSSLRSEFAQKLRGHLFLRNPFSRGPASNKTPFIIFGIDPFEASKRSWILNPLDHDSQ